MLLFALGLAISTAVAAQPTPIRGTVVEEGALPLIGASVLAAGTSMGTVTDINGNFQLSVPEGTEQLIISYTGYATLTVNLDGSQNYGIVLAEDATQLLEVVVVGYGAEQATQGRTTEIFMENATFGYIDQKGILVNNAFDRLRQQNSFSKLSQKSRPPQPTLRTVLI